VNSWAWFWAVILLCCVIAFVYVESRFRAIDRTIRNNEDINGEWQQIILKNRRSTDEEK